MIGNTPRSPPRAGFLVSGYPSLSTPITSRRVCPRRCFEIPITGGIQEVKRSEIKRRPLADTTLAGLEPEPATYREQDGNGLYFRVKPNGQKSWELRYKKADGKWSWLGLGGYPEISGSLARQKAAQLREDASTGKNPSVSKQARKVADQIAANNTFEALGREWFEARRTSWESGTSRRVLGALEFHVFPVFGKRVYTEILPLEWMEFLRGMEQKGIIEQMGRVRAFCKEIYDLARVTGRAVHNPLEGLSKFLQSRSAENYAHVSIEQGENFGSWTWQELVDRSQQHSLLDLLAA